MDLDTAAAKPRLCLLLAHLARIKDEREPWRVAFPLREVLFLVVCGTIANNDDYEDIVDWGMAHLEFLRGFCAFHHGLPCADWLRSLMNRIDPKLFKACFCSWVAACWPDLPDLIAIDGKTSRHSHDRRNGRKPLHLVSAFATRSRLVLGQQAVDEKSNEITAIPALIARIDVAGALLSTDAILTPVDLGCNPGTAQAICDAKGDYLLAVKDNQPTLHAEIEDYFETAPQSQVACTSTLEKDHGRIEERTYKVSHVVDWLGSDRSYPGMLRFPKLACIAIVESRTERDGKTASERRSYISSRHLTAEAFAQAARGHWRIENSLHWCLDVIFGEDQSRLRVGHGALNMAIVRHFAFNLLRQIPDKLSLRRRRKRAAWDSNYLLQILQNAPS